MQLRMNNVDTRGNFMWDEFIRVPADAATIEFYRLTKGDVLSNNTNSTELVGKSALFAGHSEPAVAAFQTKAGSAYALAPAV